MITTSETPGVVAPVPDRGWPLRSLSGGCDRFSVPGPSALLTTQEEGPGDGGTPLFPNPATGPATRSAESDRRVELSELGLSLTAGRGRLVLVTGERGSGRSRLAMSVLDGVRSGADVALIGLQGAPGYPATAALGLLRAVARTRPEGPAARLVSEAGEEPQSPGELVEELALALVAEAVRRPVAVLLEDVHVADEDLLVFVEHLLTVVDTVPLLLVVTAATGWGAAAPRAGRWRSWIGRFGTLHLPVPVPTRAELAGALSDTCRARLSPQSLDAVLENARGNPRIAQELALWTLEGSPADVPGTCLVRELVGAHEQEDVLAAVAVADMPVDSRLVGRVTSTSSTASREVLERARTAGLVRYHREAGCVDTYTMAHPMYAAAARSLIDRDRMRSLHLAISSVLISEHAEAPDAAPQIARHLVASRHPRAETGDWCLRAARWCESVGRLTEAVELAQAGLDAVSDLDTRMELVAVLSGCYRRLGDARAAAGVLRAALRLVSGQPRLGIPLAAELLELRDHMTASAAQTLLAYAQQSCPPDRPDLLVRLAATEAAMTFDRDPAAGRRAAQRMVRTVDSVDDEAARAAALRVAARTLMGPAHLGDLQRVATTYLAEPGLDGLHAAAAAAMAGGDGARLNAVLGEYTWRETRHPAQSTRDELTLLRGVVATLQGRKAVLSQSLLHLSPTATPQVAMAAALLPYLWTLNTRGAFPAHGPEINHLPGADAVADLRWLAETVTRPTSLDEVEVRLMRQRIGDPAQVVLHEDGTSTARLAAAAIFGAGIGDRDLCTAVVPALEPHLDQFVMIWPYLPVGPVGWFLAPALRALGRPEAGMSALKAAQAASERLGAPAWTLRLAAEQARLSAGVGVPDVSDVINASVGPAVARRFPGVVAEIRCRLGHRTAAPGTCPDPGTGASARPAERAGEGAGTERVPATDARPRPTPAAGEGPGVEPAQVATLTPRETDIMALAAEGCTNQEIAKRLFLSVATVERHCTNLYRRLGVRNRAQALGILGPLLSPESER